MKYVTDIKKDRVEVVDQRGRVIHWFNIYDDTDHAWELAEMVAGILNKESLVIESIVKEAR